MNNLVSKLLVSQIDANGYKIGKTEVDIDVPQFINHEEMVGIITESKITEVVNRMIEQQYRNSVRVVLYRGGSLEEAIKYAKEFLLSTYGIRM